MASADKNSAVWKQWEHLLDKCHRRFNKLQAQPPSLPQAQYIAAYVKTANCFSRLWKFQQDNRAVLMDLGLRRSEVGEIASKIGQLYYNYYLRTGDTSQLAEAYVFYEALHSRQYFADAVNSLHLAVKQLRFIARFIVVCLLLSKKEEGWALLQEFNAALSAYVLRFSPKDGAEWQRVLDELTTFMHAEVAMPVPRSPGSAVAFKPVYRARAAGREAAVGQGVPAHVSRLKEAVLVSYHPRQVKVAELPVDMFRMALSMEWQGPSAATGTAAAAAGLEALTGAGTIPGTGLSAAAAGGGGGGAAAGAVGPGGPELLRMQDVAAQPMRVHGASGPVCRNPARHLLYKPTWQTLMSVLTSVNGSLCQEEFMLLYISASAPPGMTPKPATANAAATVTATAVAQGLQEAASSSSCGLAAASSALPSIPSSVVGPAAAAAVAVALPKPSLPLMLAPITVPQAPHAPHAPGTASPPGQPLLPTASGNGAAAGASAAAGTGLLGGGLIPGGGQGGLGGQGGGVNALPRPLPCDGLLHAEELLSLTRRRLMVVVDSDAAPSFAAPLRAAAVATSNNYHSRQVTSTSTQSTGAQSTGTPAFTAPHSTTPYASRQPLLVMVSQPAGLPGLLDRPAVQGSFFTMGLTCPLMALCVLAGCMDPSPAQLQSLEACMENAMQELSATLAQAFALAGPGMVVKAPAMPSTVSAAAGVLGPATPAIADTNVPGTVTAPPGAMDAAHASWAAWGHVYGDVLLRRYVLHFAFLRCALALRLTAMAPLDAHAHAVQHNGSELGGQIASGAASGISGSSSSILGNISGSVQALLPAAYPGLPPCCDATDAALQAAVLRAAETLHRSTLFVKQQPAGAMPAAAVRQTASASVPQTMSAIAPQGALNAGTGAQSSLVGAASVSLEPPATVPRPSMHAHAPAVSSSGCGNGSGSAVAAPTAMHAAAVASATEELRRLLDGDSLVNDLMQHARIADERGEERS